MDIWKPEFKRTTQAWENGKKIMKTMKNQNMAIFDTFWQFSQASIELWFCSYLVRSRQKFWYPYCPYLWQFFVVATNGPPYEFWWRKNQWVAIQRCARKNKKHFGIRDQNCITYNSGRSKSKRVVFWTTLVSHCWAILNLNAFLWVFCIVTAYWSKKLLCC